MGGNHLFGKLFEINGTTGTIIFVSLLVFIILFEAGYYTTTIHAYYYYYYYYYYYGSVTYL